ncbi:MAG: hypothetical protein JJU18_09055 [Oceanicaulis sp.]|nr:hypothetical protein [Oceanicaulis sp.]
MAELAQLTARLEALRAARASGVRKLKHADREIEYRSDSEIASAIADLERQVAALTAPRIKTVVFTANRGI